MNRWRPSKDVSSSSLQQQHQQQAQQQEQQQTSQIPRNNAHFASSVSSASLLLNCHDRAQEDQERALHRGLVSSSKNSIQLLSGGPAAVTNGGGTLSRILESSASSSDEDSDSSSCFSASTSSSFSSAEVTAPHLSQHTSSSAPAEFSFSQQQPRTISFVGGHQPSFVLEDYQDEQDSSRAITSTSAPARLLLVERKPPPKFLPKPVANVIAKKHIHTLFNSDSSTHTGSGSGRSLGSHSHSCNCGGLTRLVDRNQKAITTAGIKRSTSAGNIVEWKKSAERKTPPKFLLPKPVSNLLIVAKKRRPALFNSNNSIHSDSGSVRSLGSLPRSRSSGGNLARLVRRTQKATMTAGIKTSNNAEFEDGIYNSTAAGSIFAPRSKIEHCHSTHCCSYRVTANEAERLVQMGELEAFDASEKLIMD